MSDKIAYCHSCRYPHGDGYQCPGLRPNVIVLTGETYDKLIAEPIELRAENERLRAALESLTDYVASEMTFTLQANGWNADDEKLAALVMAARDALDNDKCR